MSVERQWRTTGSLGAKPYPPLEQSATALDQLRLVIQKLEIRDSIQLLNWKTLPEIPRQQCISVRTDCIFMYYILYNDNYNKYIYIYCLLAVILPSYVNSVHNMANHQMINPKMSAVSLSSVQDMEVGSAPVESTNTWAPGVSFQLLGGAQAPKKKVVFEKHVPWSTCNGLIRFMVIHPIIGILVLGVCVGGVYREIPINGLMTLPQYGYYMVLFYPPFDHGTYSFSSHHFMAGRSSNMVYILKHVETCWNHHQQYFWYS